MGLRKKYNIAKIKAEQRKTKALQQKLKKEKISANRRIGLEIKKLQQERLKAEIAQQKMRGKKAKISDKKKKNYKKAGKKLAKGFFKAMENASNNLD